MKKKSSITTLKDSEIDLDGGAKEKVATKNTKKSYGFTFKERITQARQAKKTGIQRNLADFKLKYEDLEK